MRLMRMKQQAQRCETKREEKAARKIKDAQTPFFKMTRIAMMSKGKSLVVQSIRD